MRFSVAKQDLESALKVVGASVSNSGAEIDSHFTFRRTGPDANGKHGVEVLSYCGSLFSSCPLIVSVDDPGDKDAFTVESWRLKQWIQAIPQGSAPEFTFADNEVTVRVKKGQQTFQSLDPKLFPYWDKALKTAKVVTRVPADRLGAALAYSKQFASDKDTTAPELCVCEVREGILYSTDRKAFTLIQIPGMDQSTLRVNAKNVGSICTFLGTAGDGEVELLEHDRMAMFRRGDGALFGESKFKFAFPSGVKISMTDADHHSWTLPKAELQQSIGFLVAGAVKEDNRLGFAPGEDPNEVVLSMASATGKPTVLTLSTVEMLAATNAPPVPDEGFYLDYHILNKVLGSWKGDTVRFGITIRGDKGLVRFADEQFESKYLTILAWLR